METTPTRDRVHEMLRESPGASTRAFAAHAGLNESTIDYHLRRLRRAGLARAERAGREVAWFPSGGGFCPVLRQAVPAFRRTHIARVAWALTETPEPAHAIATRAGCDVGSVRWATSLLVAMGLAEKTANGRVRARPEAHICVSKATTASRCDLWGHCAMSRERLTET